MSYAIIDAREWQNMFDLKTGEKETTHSVTIHMVKNLIMKHPYPGDVEIQSNRWVSDVSLELIEKYRPQLACVSYAQQYFSSRYVPLGKQRRQKMISDLFEEIDRFKTSSGYTPIIIGTGDMTTPQQEMDLCNLDGLAISSNWSVRYAGLHKPSKKDLDIVTHLPGLERVVTRAEWLRLFDLTIPEPERVPEYLLVAKEGWTFKTMGQPLRQPVMVPGESYEIPVSTSLGNVSDITDIQGLVLDHLKHEKIALILVEGIGVKEFPLSYSLCKNHKEWFYYEPGDGQYLTISTGSHQVFAYPPGYRYFDDIADLKEYPFSGYFKEMPTGTIGERFEGKSIAVGNRSMFMHTAFGADICVECFARNLFNQGVMAVIHREN